MDFDPRYLEGLDLFNRQRFFEAHDVWEEIWRQTEGPARDFLRGLIQVASAFHHFQKGNLRGARLLHDSGLGLLAPYGPSFMGLNLTRLRDDMARSFREIREADPEDLPGRRHPGAVRVSWRPDRAFRLQAEARNA